MGRTSLRSLPLNTLRVFEITARHLSFTRAASELHVSQAAISRQVRQLESSLGKPLFVRLHRRVELTSAGQRLADDLSENFAAIERSVEAVRRGQRETIRLSVEPAFAARWLLARVPQFLAAHADIDLEIESTEEMREVGREADMAIRYRYLRGTRRSTARTETRLADLDAFPVLAPSLGRRLRLRRPEDLQRQLLLHEDDGTCWQEWLSAAGITTVDAPRRMRYNDVALVLQAAVDGQGIALGDGFLCGDDLRAGRLVKPFKLELPCGAYWLAGARDDSASAAQRIFADWLCEEVPRSVQR